MALNGTVSEIITEDSGLAGHLHLSHNNTVIHNVPLNPKPTDSVKMSSKLLTSSMSSSILSSSLKLARQLLEEKGNTSEDTDRKDESSSRKNVTNSAMHDIVVDTEIVTEKQRNEEIGGVEKSLPVVHHVDRFRSITFKLFMQEQVTAVSMGTSHTAFVTGGYILCLKHVP